MLGGSSLNFIRLLLRISSGKFLNRSPIVQDTQKTTTTNKQNIGKVSSTTAIENNLRICAVIAIKVYGKSIGIGWLLSWMMTCHDHLDQFGVIANPVAAQCLSRDKRKRVSSVQCKIKQCLEKKNKQ